MLRGYIHLLTIALLAGGLHGAVAQTAGPVEGVTANGEVAQKLALTPAQRSAIYNMVVRERVRPRAVELPLAIGASVPPSAELRELPDLLASDSPLSAFRYVIAESNVILVDPVKMRVVDIIFSLTRP